MNKPRLGWIMEDPTKKPKELQEKAQKPIENSREKAQKPIENSREKAQKPVNVRYYYGKYKVEFLRKTPKGCLCKALAPFTVGYLTVKMNGEFLTESRFLWKTKRKEEITG